MQPDFDAETRMVLAGCHALAMAWVRVPRWFPLLFGSRLPGTTTAQRYSDTGQIRSMSCNTSQRRERSRQPSTGHPHIGSY